MPLLLPDWRAVRFSGEDRLEWLNGQLTQDVLARRDALFCWLEPSGRCLAFGGLVFGPVDVLALLPAACVGAVLRRVEEMVVMEDVRAEPVEGAAAFQPPFGLVLAEGLAAPEEAALNAALLERGFPVWGVDVTERTIPFDLGETFVEATVSPNKGCYVGQEVIARMRARNQRPREWVGLLLDEPIEPGAAVGDFGTVTRAAVSPTLGPIAAASISKKRLEEGEIVEVTASRGKVKAEVRRMPLLRD